MADGKATSTPPLGGTVGMVPRLVGSLREVLAAADRADGFKNDRKMEGQAMAEENRSAAPEKGETVAAAEAELVAAVREARGEGPRGEGGRAAEIGAVKVPPPLPVASEGESAATAGKAVLEKMDREADVTTRLHRARPAAAKAGGAVAMRSDVDAGRTRLVRGKSKVTRAEFHQDPVVGWLVVVGGPGLGAFRPVFEGNNTVGRSATQRVPIDFGDDTISSEEQAYIRYDSVDRSFLFVPNLAKTNIVSINDRKPTAAVPLAAMDVITMGRTQLVFVPFCGEEFDWSELSEAKD